MKKQNTLLVILTAMLCCSVLFSLLIFAATKSEKLIGVNIKKEDVPYQAETEPPKNTTVLFCFEDESGAAIQLDFENNFIDVVILEKANIIEAEQFGYFPTETVYCDYSFLLKFIDTIDGINLNIFGEELRYTGVQVCNILAVNSGSIKTKRDIISAIFEKISKNDFSSEVISCIINNTKTSLNAPDCFLWADFIGDMCKSYNIVNEG